MPHLRFTLLLAVCAALLLGRQATASAATASTLCTPKASASYRSLASARTVNKTEVNALCAKVHKSRTVLKFFAHHPVAVAPRYDKCWMVPDKNWRQQVCKNRAIVRQYRVKLTRSQRRLNVIASNVYYLGNVALWTCIHGYEGAWNDNTGNGYYGGLQMDLKFQRTYGPEFLARYGTADKWPIWAQIAVAQRALEALGDYSPWPNTAAECKLPT